MDRCIMIVATISACLSAQAGIPTPWTVETSRIEEHRIEAFHGESIDLEAALNGYGTPLEMSGKDARLYWQTNGMGRLWWSTNATVSVGPSGATNAIRAVFSPTMDPGANVVRGFLGVAGENYRANFTIRFRDSPGASPNVIRPPVASLDFATVAVSNAPWIAETVADGRYATKGEVAAKADATNVYTKGETESYVQGQITSAGAITESGVRSIVTEMGSEFGKVQSVNGKTGTVTLVASDVGAIGTNGKVAFANVTNAYGEAVNGSDIKMIEGSPESIATFVYGLGNIVMGKAENATTLSGYGIKDAYITNNATIRLGANEITPMPKASGDLLAAQVSAIGAHLNAEDARFVVTNYDQTVLIPEAKVEIKMPDQSWTNVWNETTRWKRFVGTDFDWEPWVGFYTWRTNVEGEIMCKAERNWGMYDSETGGLSPEGYVQISTPNILIAKDMAYQRKVTSGGSVWVLQCNSGTATLGGTTNGFFRILDGEGNVQFEIVKGDKHELGANASGITVDNSTSPPTVTIPYSVEADAHPTIQCSTDLSTWKDEDDSDCVANVSWSGSSGAYVATVQRKTAGNQLFVKATYIAGGETYIRNNAPVSMDSIIINGTNFYLGTAEINGILVPSLRTTR